MLHHHYSNKTIILINMILFEGAIIVFANLLMAIETENEVSPTVLLIFRLSILAGIIASAISLYLVREIIRLSEKEQDARVNEVLLKESKETVDLLRMQRHDFMNHMQVIHGMLQMNKNDQAMNYIQSVSGISIRSHCNDIENPVISALVAKKGLQAKLAGVNLYVHCQTNLDRITLSFSDIARILSNLLDNAIRAAAEGNEKGMVELELCEEDHNYMILVKNTGCCVPEENRKKIFEKGFTTKKEEGHGFGLYIVTTLLEENRGYLEFSSSKEEGTIFRVFLPKVS